MIRWIADELTARVLAPQAVADEPAYVDPDALPLSTTTAELDLVKAASTLTGRRIGGGWQTRHTLVVVLRVVDGDLAEAMTRRDRIVLELVDRLETGALLGLSRPDGREETDRVGWAVDYSEEPGEVLTAFATWTITVDTDTAPSGEPVPDTYGSGY